MQITVTARRSLVPTESKGNAGLWFKRKASYYLKPIVMEAVDCSRECFAAFNHTAQIVPALSQAFTHFVVKPKRDTVTLLEIFEFTRDILMVCCSFGLSFIAT